MTEQTNHAVAVNARSLATRAHAMAQMQYPASAEGISNMRQLAADLAEQSLRTNRIILGFQNQCVAYQERLRIEGDSIAFLLSLLDDEQEAAWCAHIGGEPQ